MLLVGLAACGGDEVRRSHPVPPRTPRDPAAVVTAWLETCPAAPLARELVAGTGEPTTLRLRLRGEGVDVDTWLPEVAVEHRVPVLGAKPDRDLVLTVELRDAWGRVASTELGFHTDPLPDGFPRVRGTADLDEPLVMALRTRGGAWAAAVDGRDGEVVWWTALSGTDVTLERDGNFLAVGLPSRVVVLDRCGRTVRDYGAGDFGDPPAVVVPGLSASHDVVPLADGFVTLARRQAWFPAYPTSYATPTRDLEPHRVAEDAVVHVTAAGQVVSEWRLSERLDRGRIGFGSLRPTALGLDWSHANALLVDGDRLVVSVRHQDALVALDRRGAVRWILANPLGWDERFAGPLLEPVGDVQWPLHPHGPSLGPDGAIVLFDNGNFGRNPYEPKEEVVDPTSRVAAYRVDEAAGTVTEEWAWYPPEPRRAPAMGNAAVLPDGRVVADFGYVETDHHDEFEAWIYVFDPATGALSGELHLDAPDSEVGVTAYRALPIPNLYPETWPLPAE